MHASDFMFGVRPPRPAPVSDTPLRGGSQVRQRIELRGGFQVRQRIELRGGFS
jgi:hypothetical protein